MLEKDEEKAHKELLLLYGQLKSEILANDTVIMQILAGTVVLVPALMAFAFKTDLNVLLRLSLFFCAIVVVFSGLNQSLERVRGTMRVATYMRLFIEPHTTHLKWETKLHSYRQNTYMSSKRVFTSVLFTYVLIGLANFMLVIIYSGRFWHIIADRYGRIGNYFETMLMIVAILLTIKLCYDYFNRQKKYENGKDKLLWHSKN